MSTQRSTIPLTLCLIATAFSGIAGLTYEIVWQKLLSSIVGSSAGSHAIILAMFLGGLGIGYLLAGLFTSKVTSVRKLLLILIAVEIMIGLWGISIPGVYASILSNLEALFTLPLSAFAVNLGVTGFCLGIPAIFMGTTLPILTQAFTNDEEHRSHSYFYSVNTAGAFVGALLSTMYIVPSLNLMLSSMIAGVLNLLSAMIVAWVYFMTPAHERCVHETAHDTQATGSLSMTSGASVAFLLGVLTMTFQTITFRHVGVAIGASEYVFGLTVSSFILLIALGSYFCAGRRTIVPLPLIAMVLFLSLFVSYLVYPYWPYLFHLLRITFSSDLSSFYWFHMAVFAVLSALISVPVLAMGGLLPALFWSIAPSEKYQGYTTGLLYGANTLGSIAGALLGGYFALYVINIDVLFKCLLLGALLVYVLVKRPKVYLLMPACLVLALPAWNLTMRGIGLFHEREALEYTYAGPRALYESLLGDARIISVDDGPITTATVIEFSEDRSKSRGFSRTLMVNGKSDGNTSGDKVTMRLLGHLPGLLGAGAHRRGAVVGFGTGMTLGSLSLYDDVETLDLVEISPAVLKQARYFDFANNAVSSNEKVRWHLDDAYHFFLHTKEQFDVVIVQPSNPWLAGLERLYSEEFYRLVADRMSDEGVFTQWISLWGLSPETVRLMLTTVSNEFSHVRLFEFKGSLLILASKQQMHMPARFMDRFNHEGVSRELKEIGISSPEVLLAMERWMPPRSYRGNEHQSLHHPILAYRAAHDFFQDASMPLEELIPDPSRWKWSRAFADVSFLADWIESHGMPNSFDPLIQASCGGSDVSLVEPVWRYMRSPCRDALLAAYLRGERLAPESMQGELQWLRTFSHSPNNAGSLEVPHAALFAQFDSIFIKLSEEALLSLYKPCWEASTTEALNCQKEILKIFTFTNRSSLSSRLLQETPALASDQEVSQYLSEVIELTDSVQTGSL